MKFLDDETIKQKSDEYQKLLSELLILEAFPFDPITGLPKQSPEYIRALEEKIDALGTEIAELEDQLRQLDLDIMWIQMTIWLTCWFPFPANELPQPDPLFP